MFFKDADFNEKFLVLQISRLGFANRLRTLADWYAIAKSYNRTLLVNWIASPDCSASFTDLFENGPSLNFQGTGKSTLLKTQIRYIYERLNC